MFRYFRIIFCVCVFLFCYTQLSAQKENIPTPFYPEIISQFSNVRDLTVTKTEDEAYFTVQSPLGELSSIAVIKKINGKWTSPEVVKFSGRYNDLEPFLSPDGLKLYFVTDRPVTDTSTLKDYNIWAVGRKDIKSEWSIAFPIGEPVNSSDNEFYPCIAKSGNLYFTCDGALSKGKDDIFICKWNQDHYEAPVSLSDSINSDGYEFNAFVSSNESYIIYTCYNRKGGFGSGDLYISYNVNGMWSAAVNMGENINSPQMDYCPYVNEKAEVLYFTSRRSGIKNDPSVRSGMVELKNQLERYDNGMSRIYKVDFDKFVKKNKN